MQYAHGHLRRFSRNAEQYRPNRACDVCRTDQLYGVQSMTQPHPFVLPVPRILVQFCEFDTRRSADGTVSYLAHFGSYEVAKPVEPLHVGLEVSRLLHVLERGLQVRILLGECLNELLWPNV